MGTHDTALLCSVRGDRVCYHWRGRSTFSETPGIANLSGHHAREPLKAVSAPVSKKVTKVGIDDWAFRRGLKYGTILVDLESHRVIDLLPDRTVAISTAWFNGVVEGHVNRLKLIKRMMYGRAEFPLLRQRVLKSA